MISAKSGPGSGSVKGIAGAWCWLVIPRLIHHYDGAIHRWRSGMLNEENCSSDGTTEPEAGTTIPTESGESHVALPESLVFGTAGP
jgi:hypothetical protein